MKKKIWLFCGAAAVVIAAAALLLLYQMEHILPVWIDWQECVTVCDPAAGEPERIVLEKRVVQVYDEGKSVWQSDAGVRVQDVLWCDIDRDEQKELLLLCWKRGRYGNARPFWVDKDETNWSQHIFIYDWTEKGIWPIWMASDIGMYATQWEFGENCRLVITDREGMRSAWDWVSWGLSNIPLQQELSFAAVGDNLIHRQIYDYVFRNLDGCFDDLFAYVRDELSQYDVTSINQETIYVDRPELYGTYPSFGTPIEVGEAVVRAGFDVVSCATNHALDRGVEAIDLTVDLYKEAGVVCAGIQSSEDEGYRPYEILERNGIRCAVFSYTQWTNGMTAPEETPYVLHLLEDEEKIRAELLAGKANADACIVYVHWGTEYAQKPDETQLHWAKVFADCGVDVVIGTHPHVIQPYQWVEGEKGNKTLVYYSLGNFISAQEDEICRIGGLAYFTLNQNENGLISVSEHGMKEMLTTWDDKGHFTTKMKN